MIAFAMIQKPVKIECKVHAEPWVWATYKGEPTPRIFDFVLDGKLNLSRTSGQDSSWMLKVRKPNNSYRF